MTFVQRGFTLMELMVTIAVAGILLTLGVPSFVDFIRNNRVTTYTNGLVTALHLARSEAIKRNGRVTVCKSSDGASCAAGGGWDQGFIVYVETSTPADTVVASTADLIRVFSAGPGGVAASGSGSVADYVSYVSSGLSRQTNNAMQMGTITVCSSPAARLIVISGTGRVRIDPNVTC